MSTTKSRKPSASTAARKAATKAATSAAKGAARSAAKSASAASAKAVHAGSDRIGRGTRWTEEQVKLLLDTVGASKTAKEAFELVARELGKSTGTVAQKYYNLQKAASGGRSGAKRGRPRGSAATRATRASASTTGAGSGLPSTSQLRSLAVDDLVGLAARVKDEIDRRREELDAAAKALKG